MAALSTGIASMSSLRVRDTKKQRPRRCNDARLTESRNAKSGQLFVMPTELLTKQEWLPGELLSGLECSKISRLCRIVM